VSFLGRVTPRSRYTVGEDYGNKWLYMAFRDDKWVSFIVEVMGGAEPPCCSNSSRKGVACYPPSLDDRDTHPL
jgi:hypothetical protein